LSDLAINVGQPCTNVNGVYRKLEDYLLRVSEMYMRVYGNDITWFNGEEDVFRAAIGADGAPFGKDDTATAFLLSFLNTVSGVASCNENFLLMGANCSETHPLMYVKNVVAEMEEVESKVYNGIPFHFVIQLTVKK
jgi:hypothetical protein